MGGSLADRGRVGKWIAELSLAKDQIFMFLAPTGQHVADLLIRLFLQCSKKEAAMRRAIYRPKECGRC